METPLVFIVDDDPSYRGLLAALLDALRIAAAQFESGTEALAALRGAAMRPRLILLDYHMPAMEAPDVLRSMREQDITGIRVAVLSNDAGPELLQRCLDEGAEIVLRKPVRAEDTLRMLQSTLEGLV